MESSFNVEQRKVAQLLSYIMNKLSGQSWEPATEESESDGEDIIEDVGEDDKKRKEHIGTD